jgi:hypothetical protein
MLAMGVPVLCVQCGQRRIADDQQIFRVLLLRGFGEVKEPPVANGQFLAVVWVSPLV